LKGSSTSLAALLKLRFHTHVYAPDSSHRNWDGKVAQSKLRAIAIDFAAQKDGIVKDTGLTLGGKRDRFAELEQKMLREIEVLKPITHARIEKRFRTLQQSLDAKRTGDDAQDLIAVTCEIERRRLLMEIDERERLDILENAIREKDKLTVDAFFRAPSFLKVLNPAALESARTAWLESENPLLARELAEARELCQIVTENFETVTSGIAKETGLAPGIRARLEGASE
jgi:hypothetical protein